MHPGNTGCIVLELDMGYVVETAKCQPALRNALTKVLSDKSNSYHRLDVIEQFEKSFDVRVVLWDVYTWGEIEFQNQEHYMEWYLRWA